METRDFITVQNDVAVVRRPHVERRSVTVSLSALLRTTAIVAVVLGIVAGALVSLAVNTQSSLVLGPGLAVIGLLFMAGFVLLSLAFMESR